MRGKETEIPREKRGLLGQEMRSPFKLIVGCREGKVSLGGLLTCISPSDNLADGTSKNE